MANRVPLVIGAGGRYQGVLPTDILAIPSETTVIPPAAHTGVALAVDAGTVADGQAALAIFSTFSPTTVSPTVDHGAVFLFTTQLNAAAGVQLGINTVLSGGFTGIARTAAVFGSNTVSGTGTVIFGTATPIRGNLGVNGSVVNTTVGHNAGVLGTASGSSAANYGVGGRAATDTAGANFGVVGRAANGTGTRTGGHFYVGTGEPVAATAALVADNGTTTDPILLVRDGGVNALSVADGGVITIPPANLTGDANFAITITTAGVVSKVAPSTSGNVLTSDGTKWVSSPASGGGTPGGSSTELQYNNGGAFGGVTNLTYNSTSKAIAYAPSGATATPLTITAGTLATASNAVYITATHNNGTNNVGVLRVDSVFGTADTDYHGLFLLSATSTQSNTNSGQVGIQSSLYSPSAPGYTGTAGTFAVSGDNSVAGTGSSPIGGSFRSNFGGKFTAIVTTTGTNVGVYGKTGGGDQNICILGHGNTNKAAPTVGVLGGVNNASGVQIGGLFAIDVNTTLPSLATSAALIADNGTTSEPIFILRSGTTEWARFNSNGRLGLKTSSPLSDLDNAGSSGDGAITTVSGTTTLNDTHHTVLVDASGGAVTINLPAAAGVTRREYTIKKIDSSGNAVTIDANGGELIDGATTQTLAAQWNSKTVKDDGSAWYITAVV